MYNQVDTNGQTTAIASSLGKVILSLKTFQLLNYLEA
ncbi:MAG: hypothetical protein ACJA2S_001592 [Cyclobacteriaceae bacterium]|jgi:hypothetical protein